jgi:hypothetical protein
MTTKGIIRSCLPGLRKGSKVSPLLQTTVFLYLPCISARIQGAGLENPRFPHEAPETRMTLETRQRQLHDEDKSCGIQPAYIRVIYRRHIPCALARVHDFIAEREREKN